MSDCGSPQLNRIRPDCNKDLICTLCGVESGSVDIEVEYEDRFVDGGGSGSGQASVDAIPEVGQQEGDSLGDAAMAKTMKTPAGPSSVERDNHEATHMPYRSWCISYVTVRAVASPHVAGNKERNANEVGMDYCFPSGTKDDAPKVLAVRSRKDGTTLSLVVPKKGLSEEWVGARVAKAIEDIGLGDLMLITKSDGEPAMRTLREVVSRILRERKGGGVIEEQSPKGESASNGMIEKAVQEIEGMIRTLRHHVEKNIGAKMKKG